MYMGLHISKYLKEELAWAIQRHRERGFKEFGQTPHLNQDFKIASYLRSFNAKPFQV